MSGLISSGRSQRGCPYQEAGIINLLADIVRNHEELIAIRRDIHAHPELAFQEQRTSALVAKRLTELGLEVHTGMGKTGVVGVLRSGSSTQSIGLRADMGALPMPKSNRFAHCSMNPGKMHGCGPDGHRAIGGAQYLAEHKNIDPNPDGLCAHYRETR